MSRRSNDLPESLQMPSCQFWSGFVSIPVFRNSLRVESLTRLCLFAASSTAAGVNPAGLMARAKMNKREFIWVAPNFRSNVSKSIISYVTKMITDVSSVLGRRSSVSWEVKRSLPPVVQTLAWRINDWLWNGYRYVTTTSMVEKKIWRSGGWDWYALSWTLVYESILCRNTSASLEVTPPVSTWLEQVKAPELCLLRWPPSTVNTRTCSSPPSY